MISRCRIVHGFAIWLAMLQCADAAAGHAPDSVSWNYVASMDARRLVGSGGESAVEASLRGAIDWRVTDAAELSARMRLRSKFGDTLEKHPADGDELNHSTFNRRYFPGGQGGRLEAELREVYLDLYAGPAYFRLGKQQIVWGQADGVKLLDVLNPQSFRDFILEDFEESRLPLWSGLMELPIGSTLLQLTWIPDLTFHRLPGPDDWYAWTSPKLVPPLPPEVPIVAVHHERPETTIGNSELAVQLSGFNGGWDWTLNYADHYEDQPRVTTRLETDGVVIDTAYRRSSTAGGSFSRPFGSAVLRGEIVRRRDLPIMGTQPDGLPGSVPADTVSALIAVDYQGWRDTWVSLQVLGDRVLEHPDRLVRDRDEYLLTLTGDRHFLNRRFKGRLQAFVSPNDDDGMVRFEVAYQAASRVWVSFGIDEFFGPRRGLFGQFADRDQVRLSIEVSR